MSNDSFVIKAFKPLANNSRNLYIHACKSVDIEITIDGCVYLAATSSHDPDRHDLFVLTQSADTDYDELIVENMNGQTVHRFVKNKD